MEGLNFHSADCFRKYSTNSAATLCTLWNNKPYICSSDLLQCNNKLERYQISGNCRIKLTLICENLPYCSHRCEAGRRGRKEIKPKLSSWNWVNQEEFCRLYSTIRMSGLSAAVMEWLNRYVSLISYLYQNCLRVFIDFLYTRLCSSKIFLKVTRCILNVEIKSSLEILPRLILISFNGVFWRKWLFRKSLSFVAKTKSYLSA